MRRAIARHGLALTIAAVAVGCAAARPASDPYRVSIDLTPVITSLGSEDMLESSNAADQIAVLGTHALPPLDVALQRENAAVRMGAVSALEQLGADGVPLLVRTAEHDPSPDVRVEAIAALGRVGNDDARAVVEARLSDPDPRLRRAALAACARTCRSAESMRTLVDAALHGDQTTPARYSVLLIALGDDAERAPIARQAIEAGAPAELAAAEFTDRFNAALLLAPLGDPAAVPVLREAAQRRDEPQVQAEGVLALAGLRDPSAVDAARAVIESGDPALRIAACQVLSGLAQQQIAGARAALAACPPATRR